MKTALCCHKILIQDFDTIVELSSFVSKGQSWEAEEGSTDDLAMCMVLFGWLSDQTYFKELTNVDVLHGLAESFLTISDALVVYGFVLMLQSARSKTEVNNS